MFCPKCSQQQISDETRFCSRCGFQLDVVKTLLANDDLPRTAEIQNLQNKQQAKTAALLSLRPLNL